jgi:hypothetical protein
VCIRLAGGQDDDKHSATGINYLTYLHFLTGSGMLDECYAFTQTEKDSPMVPTSLVKVETDKSIVIMTYYTI